MLRALAAEKEENVRSANARSASIKSAKDDLKQQNQDSVNSQTNGKVTLQSQSAATEAKPTLDYAAMTLDRLKTLEKQRDATLSFLLKRIDKAEAELISSGDKG